MFGDPHRRKVTRRRGKGLSEVKADLLRLFKSRSEGFQKAELVIRVGDTSGPTVQRALKQLEADNVIERCRSTNVWTLLDATYNVSLDVPEPEDLLAVITARALLEPFSDAETLSRIERVAEQLDDKLRKQSTPAASPGMARDAIAATMTNTSKVDPKTLQTILQATRRGVVCIEYYKPRQDMVTRRTIEPWQVRMHDGLYYVRAFDWDANAPRTFQVAHIRSVTRVRIRDRKATLPRPGEIWGDTDPRYGIDHDRPDTAVVVVRAPLSRWIAAIDWGPHQEDVWLDGGRLQRTVAYRSCREFARKLLSVLDAVEMVEPAALREEIERAVDAWTGRKAEERGHDRVGGRRG